MCNTFTGTCKCDRGFHGIACDDITDDNDIQSHVHDGPFFTGTVLRVAAEREISPQFNLFATHILDDKTPAFLPGNKFNNKNLVTAIKGDRTFLHNGNMTIRGSTGISVPYGVSQDALVLSYGDISHMKSGDNNLLNVNFISFTLFY